MGCLDDESSIFHYVLSKSLVSPLYSQPFGLHRAAQQDARCCYRVTEMRNHVLCIIFCISVPVVGSSERARLLQAVKPNTAYDIAVGGRHIERLQQSSADEFSGLNPKKTRGAIGAEGNGHLLPQPGTLLFAGEGSQVCSFYLSRVLSF